MNNCPCCSQTMLRHTRHGEIYWFCTYCHQEMPNLLMAIATTEHHRVQTNPLDSTAELLKML
ncbi:MAG: hypothetical protein VKL39_02660 [Leptolyngbyaceae bacterium]|nr:hypothetical protein [Leptolyngbyaceae bacterium]